MKDFIRSPEDQKLHKKVEELTQELVKSCNVMNKDELIADAIFNGIIRSHPTLRQSFIRNFVGAMKPYSQCAGDARDMASRGFALRVTLDEENLFPFI